MVRAVAQARRLLARASVKDRRRWSPARRPGASVLRVPLLDGHELTAIWRSTAAGVHGAAGSDVVTPAGFPGLWKRSHHFLPQ